MTQHKSHVALFYEAKDEPENGLRWCSACKRLQPESDFGNWAQGNTRQCRSHLYKQRSLRTKNRTEARLRNQTDSPGLQMPEMAPVSDLERAVVEQGACRGKEWWQDRITCHIPGSSQIARRLNVCHACPVQMECRQVCDEIEKSMPLVAVEGLPVWGGETPAMRTRRRMREEGVLHVRSYRDAA